MLTNSAALPHPELVALHARIAAYIRDNHERPVVFCCLGDSVTRGWGNGSILYHEAYPTRLVGALHDRYLGCAFQGINAGLGGDTMTESLTRLERDVLRYRPDVTSICFGLNDAMGGRAALPQFVASLHETITRLHEIGSAVIVLTPNMLATVPSDLVPVPYREQSKAFVQVQQDGVMEAFVEAMRQVAQEQHLPLADAYALWQQRAAAGQNTTAWLANGLNHPFGFAHQWFVDVLLEHFVPLT